MSLCNIFKNGLCLLNNWREFKYSYHSKHMRGLQFQSIHLLEAKHRVRQLLNKDSVKTILEIILEEYGHLGLVQLILYYTLVKTILQ